MECNSNQKREGGVEAAREGVETMEAETGASGNLTEVPIEEGQAMFPASESQGRPAAGPRWAHLDHHLPPVAHP